MFFACNLLCILSCSGSRGSCHSVAESTSSETNVNLNLDEVSKKLATIGTSIAFVNSSDSGDKTKEQERNSNSSGLTIKKNETK